MIDRTECLVCGDDCCVDETTELCDMCFEHTFDTLEGFQE
jgi:hypothetical protein